MREDESAPADPLDPFASDGESLPWPDGRCAGARITWTGVAGLRVDLDEASIAFDPFVTRPGLWSVLCGRPKPDAALVAEVFQGLDAVFLGHTHYDHAMDVPAVARASPNARFYGGSTAMELALRLGVPSARLTAVREDAETHVGPFSVRAVRSAHGRVPLVGRLDRRRLSARGVPRTPFRYPRGEVLAWRLSGAGRTFHIQGSAGILEGPLSREDPADVVLACLAARAGTPDYVGRLGDALQPAFFIPIHHDNFFRPLAAPPEPIATLDWPSFLHEARRLEHRHGTRLWRMARGHPLHW